MSRNAVGPRQWEWRSSADGYASAIGSYSSSDPALGISGGVLTTPDTGSSSQNWIATLDLSGVAYSDLSGITFRLHGYSAEAADVNGRGGLTGNLTFAGDITAVPEPSTYALAVTIGLAGLIAQRRSRRRAQTLSC